MEPVIFVVLAAGIGKRLGGETPKVLVKSRGKPLLVHILETLSAAPQGKIILVVGHKHEQVRAAVSAAQEGTESLKKLSIEYAVQHKPQGTGDAVKAALPLLKGFTGTVVILYGDMPLLSAETINTLLDRHTQQKATLSVVTTRSEALADFGRLIRGSDGAVEKIVEARDCSAEQLGNSEMNCGIYAVDSSFLTPAVNDLKNDNVQSEYYLTDIVGKAVKEGQRVESLLQRDWQQFLGVNTRVDLAAVEDVFQRRTVARHIRNGVNFLAASQVLIDEQVTIAPGVTIGSQVQLMGATSIGADVVIEGCCLLKDCAVGAGAVLKLGVRAEHATIGTGASVGPFAHLREGTVLGDDVRIGNFVETKKATFAAHSKAPHLSYIGDATVGANTNIGAGTITCNYDGFNKHRTEIGEGVFIGSNSILVAPVSVQSGALVAAGSVITKNVETDSLAVARAPQENKPGWAKRRREKLAKKHK